MTETPPQPARQPPSSPNWAHIGAALGAALSIIGAAFASFSSGGARESATSAAAASQQIIITQEMMDRARERAAKLDERITELEKWRAVEETKQHLNREGR